jgi:hypothetical protein
MVYTLSQTNCSILRKKGIPIDTSPTLASTYLLSSRTFDPLSFLSVVHANSTPNTLSSGLENLQESLQQESGALKQLVTGDFDRFVRCKNGIDEVYERMVEGGFTEAQGFGTAGIKKTLDGTKPAPLDSILSFYPYFLLVGVFLFLAGVLGCVMENGRCR